MIVWLQKDFILAIHQRQISAYGGQPGIRSEPVLDTVLAPPQRPRASRSTPPDLADLAAHLACGFARQRPFRAGNRRSAQLCYRLLLAFNGMILDAGTEDKTRQLLALAQGQLSQADFAQWLRTHVRVDGRVHEPKARYRAD